MWDFKSFAPQEESLGFEFSPDCQSSYVGWSIWLDSVSASPTCFDVGFFLFIQCGVSQLVLGFLSEEIVPYVSVDLTCSWEEMSSGSSYVVILNWNSQVFFCIQLSLKVTCYSRSLFRCQFSLSVHMHFASLFSAHRNLMFNQCIWLWTALDIMASSYTLLSASQLHMEGK